MNKDENEKSAFELAVPASKKPSKAKQALGLVNWNLVKEGGKLGIKGIFQFVGIISLFVIPNVLFILYCIYVAISATKEVQNAELLTLTYLLVIGTIFVAGSFALAQKFVLVEAVGGVYKHSSALFRKICDKIIDSVIDITTDKTPLTKQSFKKAVNISKLVHSNFGKLPRILRAGLIFILKRLPLAGMLAELHDLLAAGNRELASEKLYEKMDELILSILSQNGVLIIGLVLLLNFIVSILTIYFT